MIIYQPLFPFLKFIDYKKAYIEILTNKFGIHVQRDQCDEVFVFDVALLHNEIFFDAK